MEKQQDPGALIVSMIVVVSVMLANSFFGLIEAMIIGAIIGGISGGVLWLIRKKKSVK